MTSYTAEDRRRVVDARYRKVYNYKQVRGIPTSLVPADKAAARLGRLLDLGWSGTALEQMTGGTVTSATLINLRDMRYPRIGRATAASVMALPITVAPNEQVADESLIPTLGAQRRVQALMRLGWNHAALQNECGFNTTHFVRGTYAQTLARRWRVVDDVYRRLLMTIGPSTTTARRAERAGFAPPLAWTDVDDPDEKPAGWQYRPAARADNLRDLAEMGLGITEAARRLHLSPEAIGENQFTREAS